MPQFTRGELEVMRILWKHGELKPAEIHAHFPRKIKIPRSVPTWQSCWKRGIWYGAALARRITTVPKPVASPPSAACCKT